MKQAVWPLLGAISTLKMPAHRQIHSRAFPFEKSGRRIDATRFSSIATHESQAIAFLVIGETGAAASPMLQSLLHGVSEAANQHGFDVTPCFIRDASEIPTRLFSSHIRGVLLHGRVSGNALRAAMNAPPAVWLMAEEARPDWGDQVLPNNAVIGDLAARYLIRRGHRRLACVSTGGWWFGLRAFAFAQSAQDAGVNVESIQASTDELNDHRRAADFVTEHLFSRGEKNPTALFISDERILPAITQAIQRNHTSSPDQKIELISCAGDRARHTGAQLATIDVLPEAIGRLGVAQLIARMKNPHAPERVRTMVEPMLIEM